MIELPIFFHNDHTSLLDDIGLECSLDDCDIKNVLFVNINIVSPYEDRYSRIHSNGDSFICNIEYYDLIKKIYEQNQDRANGDV